MQERTNPQQPYGHEQVNPLSLSAIGGRYAAISQELEKINVMINPVIQRQVEQATFTT